MRIKILVIGVVILIIGALGIFYFYGWFMDKQARVANGTAKPTFPYSDYSREDLERMYPQTANENVKTTQTPEETHRKFVDYLKANDVNNAVECCFRKGDWEEVKEGFERVKRAGEYEKMVKDLDTTLTPDFVGDTKASYTYTVTDAGKKYVQGIGFIKNSSGVWLFDSL